MMPERVCLATDSRDPSGVGRHMVALADGAAAAGLGVTVVAPDSTDLLSRAADHGHAVHPYDDGIGDWLRRTCFDLVHIHAGIAWEAQSLTRAAVASAAVVIRTEHLPQVQCGENQRTAYLDSLRGVRRVVTVSPSSRDSFVDCGLDRGRVLVIPNGVDAPATTRSRSATRALLHLGSSPVVVHVGRFTAQKRHDVLLEAWPLVRRQVRDAQLLLVGIGDLSDVVARRVAELGHAGSVRMLGLRRDVGDLMAAADLLVLPSAFEGMPLVLIEAMASRLATVVTSVPGIADWVDESVAWLVPPDNPSSLAQSMVAALRDDQARAHRADAARALHSRALTAATMQRTTLGLYSSLFDQGDT